ncbi:hypothetical protein DWY84_01590 [Clostridium sp. AF27-2AA]|jgi:hypothetical protein|uniref:hypothetical protein n=1 Tax=Clostridium sp. AF27-2AA TaxID=2292206 RepID=UPI000E5277C0|nr:hypothetical protein [Clostridium sp. AF27-2AA]RHQ36306.1 hypothetical protein DWY84_01590 [Clostridium sp. AF27-2AA]
MNSDVAVNSVQIPLGVLIVLMICVAMISGMIWYNIGKAHNSPNRNEVLYKAFINMDNYVIVVALLLLIFSIGLSITGIEQNLAIVILNVFSSVVFSWLLTKKTSIKDFKEKEEELALRSYRHINYIESAANTASQALEQYAYSSDDITPEVKLILSSAKEQIKYIQGGINTCKMDWFDLLSEEEQDNQKRSEHNPNDYGTVDTVIRNEEINQEDA